MNERNYGDRNHDEPPIEGEIVSEHSPRPDTTMAMVVYALFLVNLITAGFTAVIGVVIAYVYQGKGPQWLDDHYRYQIRTFWIGTLYGCISLLFTLILIGFPMLAVLAIWFIVRCVKGFKALHEQRAPHNLTTWLL